jgi:hypothetical protein
LQQTARGPHENQVTCADGGALTKLSLKKPQVDVVADRADACARRGRIVVRLVEEESAFSETACSIATTASYPETGQGRWGGSVEIVASQRIYW